MKRSPAAIGLACGLLMAVLLAARVAGPAGSLTGLAVVDEAHVDRAHFPFDTPLRETDQGYDGQVYLALAIDPWPERAEVAGIRIDYAEYRQLRIGYPLLAWSLALGRLPWVPFGLAAANVLAVALAVAAAAATAKGLGRSPLLGTLVLALPGLWMAASRDLTEPLAVAALLGAGLALVRGRPQWAGGCLAVAALTRSEALLGAVALAPISVFGSLIPVAVAAIWYAVVHLHWSGIPVYAPGAQFVIPFLGLARGIVEDARALGGPAMAESGVELALIAWHLAAFAILGAALWRARRDETSADAALRLRRWGSLSLLLWLGFALSLAPHLWADDWAFARLMSPGLAVGGLATLSTEWRPSRVFGAVTVLMVIGTVLRLATHI